MTVLEIRRLRSWDPSALQVDFYMGIGELGTHVEGTLDFLVHWMLGYELDGAHDHDEDVFW